MPEAHRRIDPKQFEACFVDWVASMATGVLDGVVAVDGKTLRGSHDRANGGRASHVVSAWSTNDSLVLAQLGIEGKSNEITAIPRLLDMLKLDGALVTIDAMGCQREIARRIKEKKADYLLSVKENQPSLCAAIGDAFLDTDRDRFEARFGDYAEQSNTGHGRTEHRRCWVSRDRELLEPLGLGWSGLSSIVVIESDRQVADKPLTSDWQWYISSRAESAEYFLKARRAHWQVENGLHWILDVAFREDESRVRKGDGAENVSVLRRMALNLLRGEKTHKGGVESKRSGAGWDEKYMEVALGRLRSGVER